MALRRILLISAATVGLVAIARPVYSGPIWGFRSGIAASSIQSDFDLTGSDTRLGFSGSAYVRYPLGDWISIQPEIGWTSKGSQGEINIAYVPLSGSPAPQTVGFGFDRQIDYLEIPVLLRMGLTSHSAFEPFIVLGPQVGFRTGSNLETEFTPVDVANPGVQRASIFENVGTFDSPQYRDVDWSMIAGGGLALGRAPFRLVLDSRYALGLAGTFAHADASTAHNGSWITTVGVELR
jgi:outer membrane protein with beta-barrel domain